MGLRTRNAPHEILAPLPYIPSIIGVDYHARVDQEEMLAGLAKKGMASEKQRMRVKTNRLRTRLPKIFRSGLRTLRTLRASDFAPIV